MPGLDAPIASAPDRYGRARDLRPCRDGRRGHALALVSFRRALRSLRGAVTGAFPALALCSKPQTGITGGFHFYRLAQKRHNPIGTPSQKSELFRNPPRVEPDRRPCVRLNLRILIFG